MRHVVVTRSTLAVAALLAGSCVLFAWAVGGSPVAVDGATAPPGSPHVPEAGPPAAGERLFAAYCGKCHTVEELTTSFSDAAAALEGAANVLSLLEDHGAAGADEDVEIVGFLWGEVWRRSAAVGSGRR